MITVKVSEPELTCYIEMKEGPIVSNGETYSGGVHVHVVAYDDEAVALVNRDGNDLLLALGEQIATAIDAHPEVDITDLLVKMTLSQEERTHEEDE